MGKKNIEELNLMDDFLMGSVLSYPVVGPEVCRKMISIILSREIREVRIVPQKHISELIRTSTGSGWMCMPRKHGKETWTRCMTLNRIKAVKERCVLHSPDGPVFIMPRLMRTVWRQGKTMHS